MPAFFFLLAVLAGCGPILGDRDKQERMDRAKQLVDQREFSYAVEYLQSALNKWPDDLDFAALLANAHLGVAGFELLPFVNSVLEAQDTVPLDLYDEPQCDPAPAELVENLGFQCALYRAMRHLPPADHPHFLAARDVLRRYFPDVRSAPSHINFLAGLVEFGSAIARARILLDRELVQAQRDALAMDMMRFPYETTIRHLKRGIEEINRGLERLRYSYPELNRLISKQKGTPLLRVGDHTLVFNEYLSTGEFIRFIGDVLHDRGQAMDELLSRLATERINSLNAGSLELLDAMSSGNLKDPSGQPVIDFHFGPYARRLLYSAADRADRKVEIRFFELAWSKPPPIVRDFLMAAQEAWDTESGDALRAYFLRTGPDWLEFKDIAQGWDRWLNQDLAPPAQESVLQNLRPQTTTQQAALTPPAVFDPDTFKEWVVGVNGFFDQQMQDILTEPLATSSGLTPRQVTDGWALLNRTNAWCDKNFYPISEWVTVSP